MSQDGAVLNCALEEVLGFTTSGPQRAGDAGGKSPCPPPKPCNPRRRPGWDDRLVRLLTPRRLGALPPAWRYGLTAIIVAAATALRWALLPWLGVIVPYNIALVALLAITVLLGVGPGLFSVLLSFVAVEVFITGDLRTALRVPMLLRFAVNLAIGVCVACLVHAMRAALIRARESEARLASLLEASFEGIGESQDGRIVACNAQLARMLGYSVAELQGVEIASLIAPEDRERVAANIRKNRESLVEHAMLRKDGTRIIVEAHGRPVSPDGSRLHTAVRDITERKRHEQALHESEERFRLLVERVSDYAIFMLDTQGRVVTWNAGAERFKGYTAEEIVGEHFSRFYPQEDIAAGKPQRALTIATERGLFAEEGWRLRKDGTRFWARVTITAMRNPAGELRGFTKVAQDLTERKRAEQELEQMRMMLTEAERLAHLGSWKWVAATGETVWSDEEFRVFGLEPGPRSPSYQELLTKHFHPEDATTLDRVFREAVRTGSMFDFDLRIVLPDGSVRFIHNRAHPQLDGSGKLLAYVGATLDVTERKAAEEALRESEQRFRGWIRSVPIPVGLVNRNGESVYFNERFTQVLGYTQADLPTLEAWWRQAYPDAVYRRQVMENWQAKIQRSAQSRTETQPEEFNVTCKDGSVRVVVISGLAIEDCILATFIDITERKRFEEELKAARLRAEQARQAAEAANGAKDHFLSVLSHELRTPLTPVLITASALESDEAVPTWIREDMGLVRRSVQLEVKLIDDLLDINRIMRGKLALRLEDVDAHLKILSAVELCRQEAEAKNVELIADVSAKQAQMSADGGRLQQIVWNLVKNSTKFTPAGGRITVRTSNPAEGRLRIEVSDTGIGIPPEAIPRLFKAFEQADSHITKQFGGLGLGLAICKALVEMHGGTITAHSDGSGRGATFTVDLPTSACREAPAAPQGSDRAHAGRAVRILYVEDHAATALVLEKMFGRAGHEVIVAKSVREALRAAERHAFDLLVCDLGLPDGNGLDVIRELRARNPQVKGIALSGFGMDSDIERSKAAGFREHLTKPVEMAALLQAIARAAEAE